MNTNFCDYLSNKGKEELRKSDYIKKMTYLNIEKTNNKVLLDLIKQDNIIEKFRKIHNSKKKYFDKDYFEDNKKYENEILINHFIIQQTHTRFEILYELFCSQIEHNRQLEERIKQLEKSK